MRCLDCGSAAVTERSERTAQGYCRFRCRECGKRFNEHRFGVLNRTQYPGEVIALVVLWRLRYRLTLRDLAEMFLIRGIVFSYGHPGMGGEAHSRSFLTSSLNGAVAAGWRRARRQTGWF